MFLGIDPGLARLGYGVIEAEEGRIRCLDYGVITSSSGAPPSRRLLHLYEEIKSLLDSFKPQSVVLEKLFFNRNVKTAFQVGEARGVIILAAAQNGLQVEEYTPLEIKKAITGYGKADKGQVQKLVQAILHLKEKPKPDDAADALAVAICHLQTYKLKRKMGEYL